MRQRCGPYYGPRIVPDNLTGEQVLFLTDIFPTGYTGIDWGNVQGGETVAIFEPDRNILDRAKAVVNLEKGSPKVLEACMSAVRRGGTVSVLGVYPTTYDNLPVGQFFDKGIILKGGQAPAQKHIDKLLKYVEEGKVKLDDIITHRLPLSQITHAYDIFKNKEDNCVKVVLDPSK